MTNFVISACWWPPLSISVGVPLGFRAFFWYQGNVRKYMRISYQPYAGTMGLLGAAVSSWRAFARRRGGGIPSVCHPADRYRIAEFSEACRTAGLDVKSAVTCACEYYSKGFCQSAFGRPYPPVRLVFSEKSLLRVIAGSKKPLKSTIKKEIEHYEKVLVSMNRKNRKTVRRLLEGEWPRNALVRNALRKKFLND